MKDDIHPQYGECTVTCTCGAIYHTRSTRKSLHVEICASCHPFFTGRQKPMDVTSRVEKFKRKYTRKTSAT